MKTLLELFETHIAPVFMKIADNDVMKGISRGFIIASPLSISGALFQLFSSLPFGEGYTSFLASSGLGEILSLPLAVTSNSLSLLLAFTIAYSYTQVKGMKDLSITAAIVSVCAFLIVIPFNTMIDVGGTSTLVNNVIPTQWLGAQGIFVSILVAILSSSIFIFTIKKDWVIKMPEGVPSNVSSSFKSLVPGIIILLTFIIIRVGLSMTPFGTLHKLIYGLLQVPLQSLTNNIWGYIICTLLMQLLWLVGVHGPTIVFSVMAPLWMGAATENLAALTSGGEPQHIISTSFYIMLNSFGGSGMTLALVLMMSFIAKSKQMKVLGRLSLGPAIFNINEPIIFGLPIVMNPLLAIPFVIAPVVVSILAYILTKLNFLSVVALSGPTQIPMIVKAVMFGGDKPIQWIIFHIVAFIITAIIWYPFFKMMDRNAYELEVNTEDTQNN